MTDAVKIALIGAAASIISSILAALAIIWKVRQSVQTSVDGVVDKLMSAKDAVIDVKDQRIIAVQASAHAEGMKEEGEKRDAATAVTDAAAASFNAGRKAEGDERDKVR